MLEQPHSPPQQYQVAQQAPANSGRSSNPQQSAHHGNGSGGNKPDQPNILFVGNLSFFCEESHLFDLFDQYAHVNGVRIVRNDNRTRSLMFGFVTLSSVHEAKEMERVLNGSFFMGRRLKVAISDRRNDHSRPGLSQQDQEGNGIQVHVAFSSFFPEDKVIRPSEAWLRKTFTKYGILLDCCVKEYQQYKESNMQEGYGFIAFTSYEDAVKVTNICQNINVQGITLTCSMSHLLHPAAPKKGQSQVSNQMNANNKSVMNHGKPFNGSSTGNANSNPNGGNNSPPTLDNNSGYYHVPMGFVPHGAPMPMHLVPVDPSTMEGYTHNPPAYYPHSNASVSTSSTSGSGSMTMVGPPVTMSSPVPTNAIYPMPVYGVPVPYNHQQHHQHAINMVDKNRKMSPTFSSTSSYGSGGY